VKDETKIIDWYEDHVLKTWQLELCFGFMFVGGLVIGFIIRGYV